MRYSGSGRTMLESPPSATQAIDPFAEQVTYLFHFENNMTNFGKLGQLPSAQWISQGISGSGTQPFQSLGTLTYSNSIRKFGGFSGIFAGGNGNTTGNVLAIGNDFGLPMTTGDFTLELWVYPTANTTETMVVGQRANGGTSGTYLSIAAGGNGINYWVNNVIILNPVITNCVPLNQWTGLAISRQGNTWYAFVNGVCVQTKVNPAASMNIPQLQMFIASDSRPSPNHTIFQGNMDEFRFTSACRYTTSYQPATAAFPNYSQPPNLTAPSDIYWGNVALLCHMDGPVGNTTATIVDSSPNNFTITRATTGSAGTAPLQFAASSSEGGGVRWGTTSLAVNTGYTPTFYGNFSLPASVAPLNLGTADFTIEFWMGRNGATNGRSPGVGGYVFSCSPTTLQCFTTPSTTPSAGQLLDFTFNGVVVANSTSCIMDDAWHSIALTRISNTVRLFVDGAVEYVTTSNASIDLGGSSWGRISSTDTGGTCSVLIDELRVTNGVGRYYTNYLPQRAAFQNSGVVSSFISNSIGNASIIAPANSGNASIVISAAGGNGGSNLASVPGGGGGQGGIAILNTAVTAGTTYFYTLGQSGSPSYWGNSAIFGANSGSTGSPSVGGSGGAVFGSYTTGVTGTSGLVGNAIVKAGGAGGGPGGGGGQGPIPPSYLIDNLVGQNGTVNCGGGGASNFNSDPQAGLGGPPQITVVFSN